MYLLEENEKSQIMREKITLLLESDEVSNLLLAISLLEGGGIHDCHLEYLVFWVGNTYYEHIKLIEEPIKNLLRARIKQDYKFLNKNYYLNIDWGAYENEVSQYLSMIQKNTSLDVAKLAFMIFKKKGLGKKYILENGLKPELWDLFIDEYKWFSLCDITKIPPQIQTLKFLGLDICNCELEEIPDFLGKVNFHYLSFENENIKKETIKELEEKCPSQMAGYYYNIAWEFGDKCTQESNIKKQNNYYRKAHKLLNLSVSLDPNFGESWHWLGVIEIHHTKDKEKGYFYYNKAFEAYQNLIDYYTQNPEAYPRHPINQLYYWQSCILALQKRKEEAFEVLKYAISLDISHKQEALGDDDWDFYKTDEEFKKIVS